MRSHGYSLDAISYENWRRELKRRSQDDAEPEENRRAFSTLILAMTAPHYLFYQRPEMDDRNTRAGLTGTGIACGPVDETLISTYIVFWQTHGSICL